MSSAFTTLLKTIRSQMCSTLRLGPFVVSILARARRNGRRAREQSSDSIFKQLSVVIPAKAGIQYVASYRFNHRRLGILDRPPEPVIGRRSAPTYWRAMTMEIQRVGITSHSRDTMRPSLARRSPNKRGRSAALKREQGMPGARCTHGFVQESTR
jgi:hypothetical protein